MIRFNRGLFGALTTGALSVFVTTFGHSSASAQPCAALQEGVVIAAEVPVEKTDAADVAPEVVVRAFPRLEVLKKQDVFEFITNNGASFGFADGGEFVCVAFVDGQLTLMANSSIEINESTYNDEQNVVEIAATTADGKLVVGKLFLAAFSDRNRDESNVHLVFELSNPDGYEGIRFIFDGQTGAIYSPPCICAGVGGVGLGPCGVVDCDEGRVCGEPARPRGCRWDIPQGPRLTPIVDFAER